MSYQPRSVVALSGGRGWLSAEAAASIHRIDAQIGHRLQITEAGRDWWEQNAHWLTYRRDGYPIALHPDTPSVHQIGDAVDSDEAQQILAVMEDHGWRRTVYRWVNGVWTLVERWHFEHFIDKDNYRYSGGGAAGSEDDMTPEQDRRLEAVFQAIFGAANVPANKTGKITWAKPNGEKPGEAFYGIFDVLLDAQAKVKALSERPATTVTEEQVKSIADAVVKAVGKPTVTLDYAAIAKAVNDDAARRLVG